MNGQDTQSKARIGEEVIDSKGDKIGSIDEFYTADGTEDFIWASVKTGFLGFGHKGFIPLNAAKDLGDAIQVPYDKDKVKDSPTLSGDDELTQAKEQELYRYYDIPAEKPTEQDGINNKHSKQSTNQKDNDTDTTLHLHKYVVTDEVVLRIPVQHEELRIETEEPDDATLNDSPSDVEEKGNEKKNKG